MQHHITESWSLMLPDDGQGEVSDDGSLIVQFDDNQIVVSIWDAQEGSTPDQVLAGLKAAERPAPRAEFDEDGPDGTLRWACLIDENDDGHEYAGLYAYVLADREWLQLAVLYDDRRDHEVALATWRSVRYKPAA